jgi:hypothetical protein
MEKTTQIVFALLLLFSICLSGCTNNTDTENQQQNIMRKFIGEWEYIRSALDNETWSFYENGSAKNIVNTDDDGLMITTESWYDYVLDNSSVCFSTKNEPVGSPNYITMCFTYQFTNESTHLTLSSNNIVILDLEKLP